MFLVVGVPFQFLTMNIGFIHVSTVDRKRRAVCTREANTTTENRKTLVKTKLAGLRDEDFEKRRFTSSDETRETSDRRRRDGGFRLVARSTILNVRY